MKKAVVTGGAGFIGSHLVDRLGEKGLTVLVLDDLSTGREENLHSAQRTLGSRLHVERVDIVSADAVRAIKAFQPDIIFHQAAQMNVRRSVQEPVFDATKNVVGTVNVLEAAREAGTKRVFMASTGGAIYGEQESFPADEQHRIQPECPYGVSKRCGELYFEYFARAYGLQTVALRYANVYGPRQNPKGEAGVVAIFAERILRGDSLTVNGDGLQTRDFVFVSDVVGANIAVALSEPRSGFFVFNVGRGVETTVLDIVDGLRQAAMQKNPELSLVVQHGPALAGEQRRSVIHAGRLQKDLGWAPQVDLVSGLQMTFESFRDAM